jgi:hypothetical protein
MRKIILASVLAATPALADSIPRNPEVTQATIHQTICVRGSQHMGD